MALKLKVTLVRSPIHREESQKATVRGLGLRHLHTRHRGSLAHDQNG